MSTSMPSTLKFSPSLQGCTVGRYAETRRQTNLEHAHYYSPKSYNRIPCDGNEVLGWAYYFEMAILTTIASVTEEKEVLPDPLGHRSPCQDTE